MAKLILGLLLASSLGVANAAGIYVATGEVLFYTSALNPAGVTQPGSIPFAGTCTVAGSGAVDCTGIQFSVVNGAASWNYTDGVWSTVLGGSAITHTETCTQVAVSACSDLTGPYWNNTNKNGGAPTGLCLTTPGIFFPAGNCDRVSIVENPGISLQIIEQSAFTVPSLPGSVYGYVYNFAPSVVPVPPAAWLLASAFGVLGWCRRRQLA